MPYNGFREFIEKLDQLGALRRISEPVATELEITAIADAEMKAPDGGQALLFETPTINGTPSKFPLAINTYGSFSRMATALGVDKLDTITQQVSDLVTAKPPNGMREAIDLLRRMAVLRHTRPRRVRNGDCQQNIQLFEKNETAAQAKAAGKLTLDDLPVLHCWPNDGGRFFTLPCVHTRDPETGNRNVGMYRMQIFDALTTGLHWQVHKVAARHGKLYWQRNEPMPVAVTLGGDPTYAFAASAPLPDGVDELLLAGFLRQKSVPMLACKTVPLTVPADADFVLEGYVQPGDMRDEGPFGDHTGFYTKVEKFPVFHLTAITHRSDAVFPATIVGKPPMEDFYLGTASVRILLPALKMQFPEIVDIALPAEGVFHNFAFVSIKKQYAYQAYKIMHGLWGAGQMMFTKYIVVVDEDCDVQDTAAVWFRVGANTDPQRDSTFVKAPCDQLDHAPNIETVGSHMGIDATKKLLNEGYTGDWPELLTMPKNIVEKIQHLFPEKK